MELVADDLRKMLVAKEPVDAVFLVPLSDDNTGALMIKSIDAGESPMVIVREFNGNEQCLSWETVCRQYEVVNG